MGTQATGLVLGICIGLAAGLTVGYAGLGGGEPEPAGLAGDLGMGGDGRAPSSGGAAPGLPGLSGSAGSGAATAPGSAPAPGDRASAGPRDGATAGEGAGPGIATPSAPARAGAGSITVRVTRDDGRPLAGVVLELIETRVTAADGPAWRRGDPPPDDLDKLAPPNVFVSRTTGADGRAAFAQLPETSTYVLAAFLDGFDVRHTSPTQPAKGGYWNRRGQWIRSTISAPGNQHTVAIGNHVEMVALPVVEVPVAVLLPDGTPPPRASLAVKSVRGTETQAWTPGMPELRLSPGVYRLSVTVGNTKVPEFGQNEYRAAEVALVVPEQGDPGTVTVQLELRRGISGRLLGLPPGYNSWSYIWAAPFKDGVRPDAKALRRSSHRAYARGSSPVFVFRDLEPGEWAVGVGAPGKQEIQEIVTVTVGQGMATVELQVPESEGGHTQTVRVLSPDGSPLGDVTIQLRYGAQGAVVQPRDRRRTGDGSHQVTWPASVQAALDKAKQPMQLQLVVASPRYGSTTAPTALDQTDVVVKFVEPAMLEVSVTGYHGSGYEGRLGVLVQPADGGHAGQWRGGWGNARMRGRNLQGKLDAQGRYLYGPASPGKVQVTLTIGATAAQRSQGMQQMNGKTETVELAPGMNQVSLSLPALHGVTVSVAGARDGHQVQLSSADNTGFRSPAKDCASGQAAFAGLPAGKYWVNVWNTNAEDEGAGDPTVGSMTAEVPGSGVIQFARTPEDAAYVSIWDEDESPMAKAGFKEGDLIIQVNGQSFDGHRNFVKLISSAKAGKITFTVQREDGSAAKLTFDRDLLIAGLTDDGESTQADLYVQSRNE